MASVETPTELFVHKLGAALTMEETILEMLEKLQDEASDSKLKKDLQQHHRETQQQVQNLHRIFSAIGLVVEKQSCPAIEGLKQEGEQLIREVDDNLVDSVILGGVIETEHHEIAVYDGLITLADELGEEDIVALLKENLEQEEHTLKEVEKAFEKQAEKLAETVSA